MAQESSIPIGNALIIWTTLLLLWSSSFVAVRTWAKWQQQWRRADGVFVAGYAIVVVQCIMNYLAVAHFHLGSGTEDYVVAGYENWMEMLYTSQILYIIGMGLSRCSTTLFLSNLSQDKKHATASIVLTVVIIAWTCGSCFAIALRGRLTAPWESVEAQFFRWVIVETIGLIIEILLWLFAFSMIWGLNTRLNRRVKLLLIFAARLILIPIIVVRLTRLRPSIHHNTITDVVVVNILAQIAIHWAMVSECLTCLKPFLQTWHDGVLADSNTPQYWGALSNMMSNPSTHNKTGADKSGQRISVVSKAHQTAEEDEGTLKLRADDSGFSTRIASSRKRSSSAWAAETDDDIELLPASRIRVKMTTTMTSS